MINKIIKILSFIQQYCKRPLSAKYLFGKGFSIASSQILNNISNYNIPISTIIDVGANRGQFALTSLQFYPNAHIYSFEPEPNVFKKLKQNTIGSKQINISNTALGNTHGEIDFYSNSHSHASSALQVSEYQKKTVPMTATEIKIKVPINRLENILDIQKLQKPILLKLDVQGFEMEVLKGASNILTEIEYLLLEVSFVAMYNGEPLFNEINAYILTLGYELVAPVGILQGNNTQILQMDVLYKQKI